MPGLFRKRPLVVEVVEYLEDRSNIVEVLDFLIQGNVHHLIKWSGILIRTPAGDMLIEPGDYIIRGMQNEFYPCKPDAFTASYERV